MENRGSEALLDPEDLTAQRAMLEATQVLIHSCNVVLLRMTGFLIPNAGTAVRSDGSHTGLFARWFQMKLQKLPSSSALDAARLLRSTIVPNLNYRSTDDAFANSGLKFNYAARFEGYEPMFYSFSAAVAEHSYQVHQPSQCGQVDV